VNTSGTVQSVSNQRGENQVQRTYWIDRDEFDAAKKAADELGTKLPVVIREAYVDLVKRAERKKASDQ
jgi:hypothetical protein